MRTQIALLLLWLSTVFLAACDYAPFSVQQSLNNISYGSYDETKLDVYLPKEGSSPFPTVLLVHGTDVDKAYFQDSKTIDDLTSHGYAAVSINYRQPSVWNPDLWMSDTVCALAWVYAHGDDYHFNLNTIVAFGHSRGALIVSLLGSREDLSTFLNGCQYSLPDDLPHPIAGVVAYGGAFGTPTVTLAEPDFIGLFGMILNLDETKTHEMLDTLTGMPPAQWLNSDAVPDPVRQFISYFPSPWIDGTEPPFLLIHGQDDGLVPVAETEAFADILKGAGVKVDLLIVPNGHHPLDETAIHDELMTFLSTIQGQG